MSNHVHHFEVQVGKGDSKYRTKYSFDLTVAEQGRALFHYSCINTGPGYKKRLLKDGKVVARCFG